MSGISSSHRIVSPFTLGKIIDPPLQCLYSGKGPAATTVLLIPGRGEILFCLTPVVWEGGGCEIECCIDSECLWNGTHGRNKGVAIQIGDHCVGQINHVCLLHKGMVARRISKIKVKTLGVGTFNKVGF